MSGFPDIFPALNPADRALLEALAGSAESLPALVNRLDGYTALLEKARSLTPALVDSWPLSGTLRKPWNVGEPAPLQVDDQGRLITTVVRRQIATPIACSIVADGANRVSQWIDMRATGLVTLNSIMIYDDKARAAGEVIQLEVSPKEDQPSNALTSADNYLLQASVFAGTVGTAVVVSGGILSARWARLVSSVFVAGTRSFKIAGVSA